MIAGEMMGGPNRMSNSYLGFLGSKKNKAKAEEEKKKKEAKSAKKIEKKEARKQTANKVATQVKQGYEKAGGVEGIAKTISNVAGYFKDKSPTAPDYDVDMGQKNAEEEEKKGIPKEVWIIGGVALALTGIFIFIRVRNSKQVVLAKPVMPSSAAHI